MAETARDFNDRRATEEKFLAEQATDSVEVIPHAQLSKLHADEAEAIAADLSLPATAIDASAVAGRVIITVPSEIVSLTSEKAFIVSDRIAARAHEAERQQKPVFPDTWDS